MMVDIEKNIFRILNRNNNSNQITSKIMAASFMYTAVVTAITASTPICININRTFENN